MSKLRSRADASTGYGMGMYPGMMGMGMGYPYGMMGGSPYGYTGMVLGLPVYGGYADECQYGPGF